MNVQKLFKEIKPKYLLILLILLIILTISSCSLWSRSVPDKASTVVTPYNAIDCIGKDQAIIANDFSTAGFTNISLEPLADLELSEADRFGQIESITINSKSDFEGNTKFKDTAKIVIRYHSYREISIPLSSSDAKAILSDTLVTTLKNAGFSKITTETVSDLDPDTTSTTFETQVFINGNENFDSGKKFPLDAEIKIVTHTPYTKHTLKLSIDFTSNLIFNKFDVKLNVGNHTETLEHGKDGSFEYRLKEGKYTISFCKTDDDAIKGSVDIDLTGNVNASYSITCNSDKISIKTKYVENQGAVGEGQAMSPLSASDCEYKNYKDIESAFKSAGFTNISTKILYDIIWGITPEGEVDAVTVNGQNNFKRGDIFSKTASVIITYHMKAEKDPNKPVDTPDDDTTEKPSPVFYSTNDYETAKKGNTGIFSYKNKKVSDYDVYWIIDFDAGFTYFFTEGNGESVCDKIKITSGTLNDSLTITWNIDGEKMPWHLHFKYKNAPETLVISDHLGLVTEFRTTDLDDALALRKTKTIKNS